MLEMRDNARQSGNLARMSTQENQIALAPAAGHGIGKLIFDALLADPSFLKLMAQAAIDGLNAMTPARWDKESNNGKGGWVSAPDYRVRIQTFFGLLAQAEGEPIKRVIHQHIGEGGTIDPLAALQDSPALRDAARRLLEKSEFRDRNKKAKRVEAVEV